LSTFESDSNPIAVVDELLDGVVQDQLSAAVECTVNGGSQVRPGNTDVPLGWPHDRRWLERGDTMPIAVDGTRLSDDVTTAPQFRDDAHPIGYLEAGAPEIDQVAATAKLGCPLQERRLVSGVQQPVGKRGSRDPCANNQDPHFGYLQRAIRQP